MNHIDSAHDALRVFLENMVGEAFLARASGLSCTPGDLVSASIGQIEQIAEESLPLAKLLDASDLMFHAEGPGAAHDLPWLSALNWLTTTIERSLRALSAATLDLAGADGKHLARQIDMRLTGVAPGSLWVGTRIMSPPPDLLPEDGALIERLVATLGRLPALAGYIGDEGMLRGIEDEMPDPALRDASLGALLGLAPTGKRGIHTVAIASRANGHASLSQRERVVLRDALRRPELADGQTGKFVGEIRELDMDKTRFHLRGINDIGTLRCVLPEVPDSRQAKALMGETVAVSGRYATDTAGRPRLLLVESLDAIRVIAKPVQAALM